MLKKLFISTLFFAGTLLFANVRVSVTIYPLYSVVKEVGGDKVELNALVPFGIEAHEFEPTARDMVKLSKSDIFLVNGAGMEPWVGKIVKSMRLEQKTVDISQKVSLKVHKEYEGGKVYDPHYWLSFDNYLRMINAIKELLSKKDPANTLFYEENAKSYSEKVTTLKNEYTATLRACRSKKVVVNHDAFGYLADEYGIIQHSISGMSPDAKPSAKQIKELIDIVKKERIGVVFFEEFASDKVAKTIAQEAGVKTDALRPVENITSTEAAAGIGYLELMRANLVRLKGAMGCR